MELPPNFRIRPATDALIAVSGQSDIYTANMAAISALADCEKNGRFPTKQERVALARYSGWGPVPEVFDGEKWRWRDEYTEMKAWIETDDYTSARASTPNAMYTDPAIAREMWNALIRMGFDGGRIIDPSVGNGVFLGTMPDGIAKKSEVTAVEMDRLSARMCRLLYPQADVICSPLQKAELEYGYYDLAISNIPFGDVAVYDSQFQNGAVSKLTGSIHNYYFVKALELVRPGGMIAFITSRFTMDSKGSALRDYVSDKAEFLGAVRLPIGAFSDTANTEVVTDIIFLRKLEDGEKPSGNVWSGLSTVSLQGMRSGHYHYDVSINEYYGRNTSMVIGTQYAVQDGRWGGDHTPSNVLQKGDKLKNLLPVALRNLPVDRYRSAAYACSQCQAPIENGRLCHDCQDAKYQRKPVSAEIKEGSFFVGEGGRIYTKSNGYGEIVVSANKTIARIAGMITVRDAVLKLVTANLDPNLSDRELRPLQTKLTMAYQLFIMRHGYINNPTNKRAFRDDPDAPLLFSIEDYNKDTKIGKPEAIFTRRVISKAVSPNSADSAAEALNISLNEFGTINWNRMTDLTGISEADLVYELGDKLFVDPLDMRHVLTDEYLSGDVRKKLVVAEAAAKLDQSFEANVSALRGVAPDWLPPDLIYVKMGAGWVPSAYVQQFCNELDIPDSTVNQIGLPDDERKPYSYWLPRHRGVRLSHIESQGEWVVDGEFFDSPLSLSKWGTRRLSSSHLIRLMLNSRNIVVRDRIDTQDGSKYVVNMEASLAAKEKAGEIQTAFETWIWLDKDRRDELEHIYNHQFNSLVPRKYDGSHLTLPGVAGDLFSFHKHQLNSIWRGIISSSLLLWQRVSSGKTAVMICIGMELKRLGIRHKAMHVATNGTLEQYATEFQRIYPGARLLLVNSKKMKPVNRREMLMKIAVGEYDAVIITHSAFKLIPTSDALYEEFVYQQMNELREMSDGITSSSSYDKYDNSTRLTVKQLEKRVLSLEAKLDKRRADMMHDVHTPLGWEELGIDALFVDEVHIAKNLFVNTKMTGSGVKGKESAVAFDMYLKTQWLSRRCECGSLLLDDTECGCAINKRVPSSLVGASATPLSNSISEVFTLQRLFGHDALVDAGLTHFDSWASAFGETVTLVEMKPSGKGYRLNTRFANFRNVSDLKRMMFEFSDIQTDWREMGLDLPEVKGGAAQVVAVEPSPRLLEYIDECDIRYNNLPNVDRAVDNVLVIMGDAMKAATDMRLINPSEDDFYGSKINTAVRMLYERYVATTGVTLDGADEPVNLTQLVFLDSGVPSSVNFKLYTDMRNKLVRMGARYSDIEFIQDARTDKMKADLFERMNRGETRILIGSIKMMGLGMNVQRLLKYLYMLECPWTPMDVEQPEGRIPRVGNLNKEVEIYRLVTKKSFDVYRWQIVETKGRSLDKFLSASLTERTIVDISAITESFAEAKAVASDDPLMRERVAVEARLRQLEALRYEHDISVSMVKRQLASLPGQLIRHSGRLEDLHEANDRLSPLMAEKFGMEIGMFGRERTFYDSRKEAGVMLKHYIDTLGKFERMDSVAIWNGCVVDIKRGVLSEVEAIVHLSDRVSLSTIVGDSVVGNITRIVNVAKALPRHIEETDEAIARCNRLIPQNEAELERSAFKYADELVQCRDRLDEINEEIDEIRKADEVAKAAQSDNKSEEEE